MAVIGAISDWLHLLATVVWIGGMFFSLLVFMPALLVLDPPLRGKLTAVVVRRFTPIAWGAIVLLGLTGVFGTYERLTALGASAAGAYSTLLTAKLVLVAAMVVVGALVSFVLSPRLMKLASAPPASGRPPASLAQVARLQAQIMLLGRANLVMGILLLLVAVVLRRVGAA